MHSAIIQAAKVSGVSVDDICGWRRLPHICTVRFAIMDALRARGLSFAQIGRIMNRHHTTIISGLRKAEELRGLPGFEIIRSAIA